MFLLKMRKLFKKFEISRKINHDNYKNLVEFPIFYLSDFKEVIADVQGMLTDESCEFLFTIVFSQSLRGDVIEIGSWQGRSTIYLARGAKLSKNGVVYAIDHFMGNPGYERHYKVDKDDLSDLRGSFINNIERAGVSDVVNLLNMESANAAGVLKNKKVQARLLFIDGNHSYDAVKKDFDNYFDLVLPGGVIIFDDYSRDFSGIVKFIKELISMGKIETFYSYKNTFVIKK
jgi:predicted O-methyltransferase YrrM